MPICQWSTPDNVRFFPAGEVVKQLPPAYYQIKSSMRGLFFEMKNLKSESLIQLPDAGTNKVISEINKFWLMEDRFKQGGVPFKRGIIMYGPPGSGKTCALRMVVDNLVKEQKGLVVDYCSIDELKEGYEMVREIHPGMPLIVLMEDLDAILDRTYNSDLLNLLDGMYGIDKVVFVATTNYPEKLGSRIMNRPSRFDRRIFVGMPTEEARRTYLQHKVKDINEEELERWVRDTDGMSIAHLKELYVATKILDEDYEETIQALRGLQEAPNSDTFDSYGKKYRSKYAGEPECCRESVEKKDKALPSICDDKYERFGTGEIIMELKKKKPAQGSPDAIAKAISEDIRRNNGLSI